MALQRATIGTVVAIAVIGFVGLMVSALGSLVATRTISNSGSVTAVGVGVYSDSTCTTVLSAISWGTVNPGGVENYTMYVKNTGNVPVTLSMAVSNWNPSTASNYITLTWNKDKYLLPSGQVVQAVLTLSVSSSVSGVTSFGFNITITGTQ
jgi:archaellum component FlaG (FlaF/FlaG flagellin family)